MISLTPPTRSRVATMLIYSVKAIPRPPAKGRCSRANHCPNAILPWTQCHWDRPTHSRRFSGAPRFSLSEARPKQLSSLRIPESISMSNDGTSKNEQAAATALDQASAVDQNTRNRIASWITLGGMGAVTILGGSLSDLQPTRAMVRGSCSVLSCR
jgi:hypothetical protein